MRLCFSKTLQTFYFFTVFYIIRRHYKTFAIFYFFRVTYFFQFIKHAINYLIIKLFVLLNTIPLNKTKTLLNKLLMSTLYWKGNLEQNLRIFERVILNSKWKDCKFRKNLRTKNFTYRRKLYVHKITAVNVSKIYFLKNAKKSCKPNNRGLNRDWKKLWTLLIAMTNNRSENILDKFAKTSKIRPFMESLTAEYLKYSAKIIKSFVSSS